MILNNLQKYIDLQQNRNNINLQTSIIQNCNIFQTKFVTKKVFIFKNNTKIKKKE